MSNPMRFEQLGTGLGLRHPHYDLILKERPRVSWFEVTTENYMGLEGRSSGRPLQILEELRKDYPIVLHGVSLSVGSSDPLDTRYLKKLRALIDRIEPALVSDHLCWTGVDGENLHDLLPLPFTRETMKHLVRRIDKVQQVIGRRLLVENVSSYLTYSHSEIPEWEFLAELARQADCGLLLDVNNVYVSSVNQNFDPLRYLQAIPRDRVGYMHLAGYSDQGNFLLDTHDHPVSEPVWNLYRSAVRRFGAVSTLVEWDANLPSFERLNAEALKALEIQREEASRETTVERQALFA